MKEGAHQRMNMKEKNLPKFPYGAVYYRVSNPPRKDWERDYKIAAEDGTNIFRHWFLWSAIERSPDEYTWDDYDRQLDLAAENGIKTIVAEMAVIAPEWTSRVYPHARVESADGKLAAPYMHVSCATGGITMCFDNADVRQKAEEFLTRLVERYKDHPGMGGYDIWNECNHGFCYCEGTQKKFREWLRSKYKSIDVLREAWWRPGISDWGDIVAPRHLQPYNDALDWLEFHTDNGIMGMKWRADIIRKLDPNHRVTAHGLAMSFKSLPFAGTDDWRAAELVDSYGLTWGSSRHGDEPWRQPAAMDLIRCASRGKPVWHAECYGGPLWYADNVINKPRNEGRICYPDDIRYWNLTSYMHGITGSLFLRFRPLLDGFLFGAFGPYGMDGSRTDRSEMSKSIALWAQAPEQEKMWISRPVRGDLGILFVPETENLIYALRGSTKPYSDSVDGVYIGFYNNNIQADFVKLANIDEYKLIYLPSPVMLKQETADALKQWVSDGGVLVSEGCPGYWGDRAHVGEKQPNLGLDELFGCTENYVEFTPDILGDLKLRVLGEPVWGGQLLQTYKPTTGTVVGWYEDGRVAAVENDYGKGKTLLMGTMVGCGTYTHSASERQSFYSALLGFAGVTQRITVSDSRIRVRMHSGDGGDYLWIANAQKDYDIPVIITVSGKKINQIGVQRGELGLIHDGSLHITVPKRDISIIRVMLE